MWSIFGYKNLLIFTLYHFCNHALCQVPFNEFFPISDNQSTTHFMPSCDDCSTAEITLEVPFFFFNNSHKSLWLNNNGGISFLQPISQYTPSCAAQRQDFRMITPFWADVNTNVEGRVSFRQTSDKMTLDKVAEEIRAAFPVFGSVQLAWAFVITWDNVRGYGFTSGTNTFQAVLTTDLQNSFVIFYYNKIQWIRGTASNVDAKVGFDAGDGDLNHIYMFNSSCTSDIANVVSQSNYGKPGKYVFRVDQNSIISTDCDKQWDSNQKLLSIPSYISPYGNEIIQFRGPCFDETDEVTCTFYDKLKGGLAVPGTVLNQTTVACTPPFLYQLGRIEVQLLVTDQQGNNKTYRGVMYILEQPRHFLDVQETDTQPKKVVLKWNPLLMKTKSVSLHVHMFDRSDEKWLPPVIVEENLLNTGEYSVDKSSISRHSSQYDIFTISITTNELEDSNLNKESAFKLSRQKRSILRPPALSFSLFGRVAVMIGLFQVSMSMSCSAWHKLDNGPPNDLLPCPPTLSQADSDLRFEENNFLTGWYHKGADTCYRSVTASPSGGGQQCCYKYDGNTANQRKTGNIYCRPPGGGTADRFSPKTSPWKHMLYDVLPWYACCKFSDSCDKYYQQRPSDCGDNYPPPRRITGQGDPHFTTFDGMEYTFNGHGEYWLMKTENCSVQVRMIPFSNSPDQQNATVISAIAFKCQPSPTVLQIQLSPLLTSLTILLDSQPISFDSEINTLYFDVMEVSNRSEQFLVSFEESTFSIALGERALIVEGVGCNGGSKTKRVQGLLGNCDQDRNNDLETPDGVQLNPNSTMSEIHFNFGETWRITSTESLFSYNRGESYLTFHHPEYRPTFQEQDPHSFTQEIRDMCGESKSCYFDYSVTKSLTFANQTKKQEMQFKAKLAEDTKPVIMCTPSQELLNGYRLYNNYFPGSTVQTICHDGYRLRGQEQIVCTESGQWSHPMPTCEKSANKTQFKFWMSMVSQVKSRYISIYYDTN